jgi:choline dehydrogenase
MLKYFIQLENDHTVPKGSPGHGFNGFLDISGNDDSFLKNQSQALALLQATAAGFGEDPGQIWNFLHRDINNASPDRDQQVGIFGNPTHMTTAGHRVDARSPVVAVLNATNPDGSRKYPLSLRTESFVTKIIFGPMGPSSNKTPRAIGVEFLAGKSMYSADPRFNASVKGTKMQAFAKKEIIISGGVFNSPQLLKLSGIGPKTELEKFAIPVIVDLPGVGSNLQDNTESGLNTKAALNFTSTGPSCTFGFTPNDPCLPAWKTGVGDGGPYAQGAVPNAIMFKSSSAPFDERDIFMWGSPSGARGFWPLSAASQPPQDPPNTWSFSMVKMHVHGKRGTLNLTSNNPQDMPDINFRFYEDAGGQLDLQAMREGIEFGRNVVNSVPAPIGPFNETSPCPGNVPCDTKDYILKQTWSHHATSTCAIGADSDPLAVLDSKFRVRGTKGLRVVDGSVFPRPPGAFPVLPTFMLSLKAVDAILEDCNSW